MQNAALRARGLTGEYLAMRTSPEHLGGQLARLAAEGFAGLNVTVPHKERVFHLLDSHSEEACAAEAVNCLMRRDDAWHGHNTDAEGFRRAAEGFFGPLAGRNVAILGAGGAARAVLSVLGDQGAGRVDIWNRSEQRLSRLLGNLPPSARNLEIHPHRGDDRGWLATPDLIVQATSLGLRADDDLPPLPAATDDGTRACLDLVSHPGDWLAACGHRGFRVADGRTMLLWQGALAFKAWTGLEAPLDAMQTALGLS